MTKIEPISIVAAILLLIGFWFGGILGTLVLIIGAILLSLSYKRFKNNPDYGAKWILYVGAVILALSILIRLLGMSLVALF
jgi:asparagine N-glycosylation enzyme membrane subunit Stt3